MRFSARSSAALLIGLSHCVSDVASFSPVPTKIHRLAPIFAASNTDKQETDAERLLRKARELKDEAEAEAAALHETLLDQKQEKDAQLDKCIERLFPTSNQGNVDALVARLRQLQYSTDKLLEIVVRLHERELKAKGIHQVEAFSDLNTHTGFERVSAEADEAEAERVSGYIDRLIEAAGQIDEEYMETKRTSKNPKYLSHVEIEHWTMGECAAVLSGKIRELRREHEEQFQRRLHSFYEAQRKKDLPPPPEYMP